MLGGAGFLDIAHATVYLYAQGGDLIGHLGQPTLDDRRHQVDPASVGSGDIGIAMALKQILVRLGGVRQGAHGLGAGLHQHQHAAHVRVVDDGGFTAGSAALDALPGIVPRLLIGPLRYRQALQSHTLARVVHHGEHMGQAFVFLAYQIAYGAVLVTKADHAGGTAVNTQFVLQ